MNLPSSKSMTLIYINLYTRYSSKASVFRIGVKDLTDQQSAELISEQNIAGGIAGLIFIFCFMCIWCTCACCFINVFFRVIINGYVGKRHEDKGIIEKFKLMIGF